MHLLIAPNAFKNSLPADAAAAAILLGLQQSRLSFTAECFPVGDGGDGTGDLLLAKLGGNRLEAMARDPYGRNRASSFGLTGNGATAIIEMASASGLRLLGSEDLDPLRASSCGTGDLILAALDKKPRRILLGMGGSATVDGGTGILTALGIRFLDAQGRDLTALSVDPTTPAGLPASLINLAAIDTSGLDTRLADTTLTILTDVDNPLLGANGAATVFGPQKGASPEAVLQLESALQQLARVIKAQLNKDISTLPSGGTAGGAAAGLYGLLDAKLVNGIDFFLESTGFDTALDRSDWVLTGEGSIDEQTLQGKGPFGVAWRAKEKGLPVIGLAGRLPREEIPQLSRYFDVLLPINHELLQLQDALDKTAASLTATARAIGNMLERAGSGLRR